MIPFLDLGAAYRELAGDIDAAVARVLASGWYVGGQEVEAFEAEFAAYTESAHCVGTGNGLDALVLALRACGIGPGDGVIVPSNTYIATWLAVNHGIAAVGYYLTGMGVLTLAALLVIKGSGSYRV